MKFIDFEPVPGEAETLDNPLALDIVSLRRLWNELAVNLDRARSNVGEIALIYANRLLEEGDDLAKQDALPVFDRVRHEDWSRERKGRAEVGRLRALMATGEAAAAAVEAEVLAAESEDPGMLIEARYILAEASFAKLKAIDEENPRWEDDDEVRPVREALYHETVDRYLFPYLFYGSEVEEAARGLWGARLVYLHSGDADAAASCADDIVNLYPLTAAAERVRSIPLQPDAHDAKSPK